MSKTVCNQEKGAMSELFGRDCWVADAMLKLVISSVDDREAWNKRAALAARPDTVGDLEAETFQEWFDRQKYSVGAIPNFFQTTEMERAYKAGTLAASQPSSPPSGWVAIASALPVSNGHCLVSFGGNVSQAYFWADFGKFTAAVDSEYPLTTVDAWMPLPKPFQQVEDSTQPRDDKENV